MRMGGYLGYLEWRRFQLPEKGNLNAMRAWVKDDPNGEMRMGTKPDPMYPAQGFARQG